MQNAEHIEVAIRAAQIAKSVLELLEDHGIHATRLRLAMAAKQFNELNALLAKIEARANAHALAEELSDDSQKRVVGGSECR